MNAGHRRRLDAGAAAAVRSRGRAEGVRGRARQLLDRRADDVLDAAAACAQEQARRRRALPRRCVVCVSGGAPMPLAVLQDFEKTFGVRVLEGYGLSETSPVACFNQLYRPSKPGTVGLPIVSVPRSAIVDDEDRPVATGERGEVVIRGHNVMKGYYKRPRRRPRRCGTAGSTRRHRRARQRRVPLDRRSQEGHADSRRRSMSIRARSKKC